MEDSQESLEKLRGMMDIQLDVIWDFKQIFFKSQRISYSRRLKDFENL